MRRNGRFVNSIEKRPPFSLPVLDTVFTSLVIGPAAIAYWKGTWSLSDVYLFPDDDICSLIASVLFGTLVQVAFTFGQDSLQRNLRPDKYKIFYYIMSRLYTYLYGLANVNMWRGGYIALDLFCGMDVIRILVPTILSIAILTCMKSIRNLLGTPLIVALDTHDNYFQVPTMFNVTVSDLFIDTKTEDNAESAEVHHVPFKGTANSCQQEHELNIRQQIRILFMVLLALTLSLKRPPCYLIHQKDILSVFNIAVVALSICFIFSCYILYFSAAFSIWYFAT